MPMANGMPMASASGASRATAVPTRSNVVPPAIASVAGSVTNRNRTMIPSSTAERDQQRARPVGIDQLLDEHAADAAEQQHREQDDRQRVRGVAEEDVEPLELRELDQQEAEPDAGEVQVERRHARVVGAPAHVDERPADAHGGQEQHGQGERAEDQHRPEDEVVARSPRPTGTCRAWPSGRRTAGRRWAARCPRRTGRGRRRGRPGATRSAKRSSPTSVGVRIGRKPRRSAFSAVVVIWSSVNGSGLTRIVAALEPKAGRAAPRR